MAVTNPVPVADGAAAETLEHAEGRAAEQAASATRAVTLADYERLAAETPGVRLARVTALRQRRTPACPCVGATGVVTVVVVPFLPAGRPSPSRGLLRAVAAYLCPLRLVGTRVEVTGPVYTEVAVRACVAAHRLGERGQTYGAGDAGAGRVLRPAQRRPGRGRLAVRPRRVPHGGACR